jgi:hypothetical protein
MTTDKLTNALIAILEPIKPDASITVADARAQEAIPFPHIAITVDEPERHSLAIPGVMKCPVEIALRVHPGDGATRDTLKTWADVIERAINSPEEIRDDITSSGLGIKCDVFLFNGGATRWDETTFEAVFTAEVWVVRTA